GYPPARWKRTRCRRCSAPAPLRCRRHRTHRGNSARAGGSNSRPFVLRRIPCARLAFFNPFCAGRLERDQPATVLMGHRRICARGATTTLRILVGLIPPPSGAARLTRSPRGLFRAPRPRLAETNCLAAGVAARILPSTTWLMTSNLGGKHETHEETCLPCRRARTVVAGPHSGLDSGPGPHAAASAASILCRR